MPGAKMDDLGRLRITLYNKGHPNVKVSFEQYFKTTSDRIDTDAEDIGCEADADAILDAVSLPDDRDLPPLEDVTPASQAYLIQYLKRFAEDTRKRCQFSHNEITHHGHACVCCPCGVNLIS